MSALLLLLLSEPVGALQCFKLRIASRIVCPFVCTDAGADTFVYSQANTLDCPPGYSRITDAAECETAAKALGKTVDGGFSFGGKAPNACFWKISTEKINLPLDAKCSSKGAGATQSGCGSASTDAQLVCAINTGPLRRLAVRACARTHTHCLVAQCHYRRLHR
jgi:hypothetical protein